MSYSIKDLKERDSQLLTLLTQNLPDMLWAKDIDGNYIYANKSICDGLLMAKDIQEPIGKNDVFFALRERDKHKDNPNWHTFGELCFNSDYIVIDNNKPMKFEEYGNVKGELLYLEVYKAPFYDEHGNVIGTVGSGRDITELKKIQLNLKENLAILKKQSLELEFQANYDYLTELPNRVFFMRELEDSIKYAEENSLMVAILFIDIDHFKEINDSLGHYIGDQLLVKFANRLRAKIIGDNIILSRFGGDEFCIIINNIHSIDEVSSFAKETMTILKEPFDIENNLLYVGMSIGISLSPNDSNDAIELLKNADAAMYSAKNEGRNTYCYYDNNMTLNAIKRVSLETALHDGLNKDQFEPYFQPQIDATTGKIVGMEVLMRWILSTGEIVYPDTFLKFTEDTGMIIPLDRIIMKKALQHFLAWKASNLTTGSISFNLSTRQMEDNSFLTFVQDEILPIIKLYPNSIEFEVTETQIMVNKIKAIKVLKELESLGITISIDDFGTGYSSLSYIKKLPISKLKIDKSFIDELPYDKEDIVISRTIINLACTLNMSVVAEGVETKAQVDFLIANGCNIIQGYYFSKPLNKDDMRAFLESNQILT